MLLTGTTITKADANAVIEVFFSVISRAVAKGSSVNLPLVNIKAGIGGIFNGMDDFFDPDRHTKSANVTPGVMLSKVVEDADVEKVFRPLAEPILLKYTDYNSNNSINSMLTAGGIGEIRGKQLKFDKDNLEEGIFFIASDGMATKVAVISNRTESKLVFFIPLSLAPGNYTLEVRKAYGTTNRIIRKSALPHVLKAG